MLKVRIDGLDRIEKKLTDLAKKKVPAAVAVAMKQGLPDGKAAMKAELQRGLNISKSKFQNVMTGRVQDADKSRMPQAVFYSRAGWLDAHVKGATIRGRAGKGVLIPINTKDGKRIGYKAWKQRIQILASQGNLEFRKVKGKVLVYAENLKKQDANLTNRALRGHNRKVGADKWGRKRSREIPIAIFMKSVKLRKRLDFEAVAKSRIGPGMAARVKAALARL